MNMEAIFEVMNKEIQAWQDLNPWPLQSLYSALPTEQLNRICNEAQVIRGRRAF